jgi:3-hydroxy-3-methylglutaryl CoA synthase
MIGIVSYGFYLPIWRITIKEIASVWGKNYLEIENSLLVKEKTIASVDEDSLTMAFESSSLALKNFAEDKEKIKFVFFGSETPPYAVNPASTILAEFLGLKNDYLANDHQFACKAVTGALIEGLGLIKSNIFDYGLVVASDKATAKTHDALEYTAASGSVALIIGKKILRLKLSLINLFLLIPLILATGRNPLSIPWRSLYRKTILFLSYSSSIKNTS